MDTSKVLQTLRTTPAPWVLSPVDGLTRRTVAIRVLINGKKYCPMTWLAHQQGYEYTVDQDEQASKAIGFCERDALAIANAADGDSNADGPPRNELLRTCGLYRSESTQGRCL